MSNAGNQLTGDHSENTILINPIFSQIDFGIFVKGILK